MSKAKLDEFSPRDSLRNEQRESDGIVSDGLYIRCAFCRHDHSGHLKPVVDSDGKHYPNAYHIEKPLQNAAPVFCSDCWDKVEVEDDKNATFADFQ